MSPKGMDTFFERVSFKLKLLLGIAVIVVVFLLFYFLLYAGQISKIASLHEEMKNLDQQTVVLKENSKKIKEIEERIQELDNQIISIATVLPDQKEIPELLKNISSTGRMSGLEFLLFKPGPENKLEHVVEIPVNIQVQGTYLNTATFFYKLSRLSRVVNIDNFTMGKAVPGDNGFILTTDLSVKTFRLLSEAEKKEIEERKKEEENKKKKIKQEPQTQPKK